MYKLAISPKDQVAFDTHTVNSRQDLLDAIDAVDVLIEARRQARDGFQGRQHDRNSSFGTCFNCGKLGHRAFECSSSQYTVNQKVCSSHQIKHESLVTIVTPKYGVKCTPHHFGVKYTVGALA